MMKLLGGQSMSQAILLPAISDSSKSALLPHSQNIRCGFDKDGMHTPEPTGTFTERIC